MSRFANHYVTAAMSGAALITVSIVIFVVLLSLQAMRDWPLSGIVTGVGKDGDSASVAPARWIAGPPAGTAGPTAALVRQAAPHTSGGSSSGGGRNIGEDSTPAAGVGGGPGGIGAGRKAQNGATPVPTTTLPVRGAEAHPEISTEPPPIPGKKTARAGGDTKSGSDKDSRRSPAAPGWRARPRVPGHPRAAQPHGGPGASPAGGERSRGAAHRSDSSNGRSTGPSTRSAGTHGNEGGPPSSGWRAQGGPPSSSAGSPPPQPPGSQAAADTVGPGFSGAPPGHGRTN